MPVCMREWGFTCLDCCSTNNWDFTEPQCLYLRELSVHTPRPRGQVAAGKARSGTRGVGGSRGG